MQTQQLPSERPSSNYILTTYWIWIFEDNYITFEMGIFNYDKDDNSRMDSKEDKEQYLL